MDPRTAAHVLREIASFLELRGDSQFKSRAYEQAAKAVSALETDDLGALDRAGTLAGTRGLGPATLGVVRDLVATGASRYLEELRAEMPAGLINLLDVPGLGAPKIRLLREQLGIDSVDALEEAARSGRLATLKGFGPKTAARILRGIELYRASGALSLYPAAAAEAQTLVSAVRSHPDVRVAEVAGSVRRHRETIGDLDVVAACAGDPLRVAGTFARLAGVTKVADESTASPKIVFADGAHLHLHCVREREMVVALWRATGSAAHVQTVEQRLATRGYTLDGDTVRRARDTDVMVANETALYALAGLPFIAPELREDGHEFTLADSGHMPVLIELADIRGALHCHSTYSDGKTSITEMADAARARGWSYIGITDHSIAAFYAGGLSREQVIAQHREIDALNAAATDGFRILKGIEADILTDGALDYDDALRARFDFIVGSVHSRFAMDRDAMTARVLRALDDPHLTILGHPTGRLLLSREPFAIDLDAVLEKAAAKGVAIELNADPHRLDLDWRFIPRALELGITIEIGPDAHSTRNLDYLAIGVGMARKAGVEAVNVLNARSADDVLSFARRTPLGRH